MAAPRISPAEASAKVKKGEALLVCAYDDDAKCAQIKVQGAISLRELTGRVPPVSEDQEIVFYCS